MHNMFSETRLRLYREKMVALSPQPSMFMQELANRFCDQIDDLTLEFHNLALLGNPYLLISDKFQNKNMKVSVFETISAFLPLPPYQSFLQPSWDYALKDHHFEAIFSCYTLHQTNDIKGALQTYFTALDKGGVFMASFLGNETLSELRQAFLQAEIALFNGAHPHIHPQISGTQMLTLMQQARFKDVVVAQERVTIYAADIFAIVRTLRELGESNALLVSKIPYLGKAILPTLCKHYPHVALSGAYYLPLSFDIIHVIGWK